MHLNMSYTEVHKLPIKYRRWFLQRLVRHFKEKNEKIENIRNDKNNNGKASNSENMSMLNKFENQIKSRL